MLFIGICGASGSGKSTLAEELATDGQQKAVLIINQDAYDKDRPDLSFRGALPAQLRPAVRSLITTSCWKMCANLLQWQARIQKALRLYAPLPRRCAGRVSGAARRHHRRGHPRVFNHARVRAMMDLKLYMHVESDIRLLRRIQRDINERGRQIDNISSQYITTVKPMFDQYIRNYGSNTPTSSSPAAARTPRSRKSSPAISQQPSAPRPRPQPQKGTR